MDIDEREIPGIFAPDSPMVPELTIDDLQVFFDRANSRGALMSIKYRDEQAIGIGLRDSLMITRRLPDSFFLFHKAVGYQESPRFAHTVHVVSWQHYSSHNTPGLVDLFDNLGRRFRIQFISMTGFGAEARKGWARWQKFKADNRKLFEVVDANLLAEHVNIALTWGIPDSPPVKIEPPAPSGPVTLKYMVDLKDVVWDPIGVWVVKEGVGLDFVARYLPGNDEEQERADQILVRLREFGMRAIVPQFMDYWQRNSGYHGNRGPVRTTDAYSSTEEAAAALLKLVEKARDGEEVDWPGELAPRAPGYPR